MLKLKSFATKDRGVVVIEFENHLLPETEVEFEVCCYQRQRLSLKSVVTRNRGVFQ